MEKGLLIVLRTVYIYIGDQNPEENSLYVSVFIALTTERHLALLDLTLLHQSGNKRHNGHDHFDKDLEEVGPYTLKHQRSI